jgi:signal transduction histidine kinase
VSELLDTLPCGVVSFGDDGIVTFANATIGAMLHREAGTIESQHFERLLTVPGRIFFQTHFFPLLKLHGKADEIFLLLRASDGTEIGALVNAVRRERDGVTVNDCVMMEVRERRKYEGELLNARREADEANSAKSRFLTTMSHELRTPLNAISGYVQLIELGIHGPVTDAQRDALNRIDRSQRHLLRLINDILNMARIESGRVEYRVEKIPVAEVVRSVLPMVEPQMNAAGLTLDSQAAEDIVALADRDKVQQILINLLTNAMKFTPRGGRVAISADDDDPEGFVRIYVTDSGIGIPAGKLQSIFEPFVQVAEERSHRREGTGLGLAISRDLARAMNGELTVESESGSGSTFTLRLPKV